MALRYGQVRWGGRGRAGGEGRAQYAGDRWGRARSARWGSVGWGAPPPPPPPHPPGDGGLSRGGTDMGKVAPFPFSTTAGLCKKRARFLCRLSGGCCIERFGILQRKLQDAARVYSWSVRGRCIRGGWGRFKVGCSCSRGWSVLRFLLLLPFLLSSTPLGRVNSG